MDASGMDFHESSSSSDGYSDEAFEDSDGEVELADAAAPKAPAAAPTPRPAPAAKPAPAPTPAPTTSPTPPAAAPAPAPAPVLTPTPARPRSPPAAAALIEELAASVADAAVSAALAALDDAELERLQQENSRLEQRLAFQKGEAERLRARVAQVQQQQQAQPVPRLVRRAKPAAAPRRAMSARGAARAERLYVREMEALASKNAKLRRRQAELEARDMQECVFRPQTSATWKQARTDGRASRGGASKLAASGTSLAGYQFESMPSTARGSSASGRPQGSASSRRQGGGGGGTRPQQRARGGVPAPPKPRRAAKGAADGRDCEAVVGGVGLRRLVERPKAAVGSARPGSVSERRRAAGGGGGKASRRKGKQPPSAKPPGSAGVAPWSQPKSSMDAPSELLPPAGAATVDDDAELFPAPPPGAELSGGSSDEE